MAIKDPVIINKDISKVLLELAGTYKNILPASFCNFPENAALTRLDMDKGVAVGFANIGSLALPRPEKACATILRTAKTFAVKGSNGTITATSGLFYNGAISTVNPQNLLATWGQSNVTALAAAAGNSTIRDNSCDIHALGISILGTHSKKVSGDPVPDGSMIVLISPTFNVKVVQNGTTNFLINVQYYLSYLTVPLEIQYVSLALNYNATSQNPEDCVVRGSTSPIYPPVDLNFLLTSLYSNSPFATNMSRYQAVKGSGCYIKLGSLTFTLSQVLFRILKNTNNSFSYTAILDDGVSSSTSTHTIYGSVGVFNVNTYEDSYIYIPYNFGTSTMGLTLLSGKLCYIKAKISFT